MGAFFIPNIFDLITFYKNMTAFKRAYDILFVIHIIAVMCRDSSEKMNQHRKSTAMELQQCFELTC